MDLESEPIESTRSSVIPPVGGEGGRLLFRSNPRHNGIVMFKAPSSPDDEYVEADEDTNDIYEIEWSSIVWNEPVRRLINQSHAFFTKLQGLGQGEVDPKEIVEFSRLYRSVLHECILGLQKLVDEGSQMNDDDDIGLLKDQCEQYTLLEIVWHLCEVLFVETLPAGCLIQQLLEWVRWHNQHTDETLREVMSSSCPDKDPAYWTTVYSLTLQGRVEDVRKMLQQHPFCQSNRQAGASMDELLRKVPMIRSVVGRSRTEQRGAWHDWRQECRRRKDRGDFVDCPQLHILCGILSGDESCFKEPEVIRCCTVWYEMLVGRLLYCSPLILNTDYELQYIAENSLELYCNHHNDKPSLFDCILLTALQNNVIDVIKQGSASFSNWWFVAHLANLLHHRGVLVTSQLEYGSKLSEFVLVEYASSLFSHQSLWQVAIDYFSHCPTQGRHFMACYIERVPLSTEKKALKVLRVCEQYGLKEQAQSISRVLARKAYGQNQMGLALTWCIRGKDATFAAFLSEKYFEMYQNIGEFCDLDLLDHLGDAMLLSNSLTFLGKYREAQSKYSRGDFKAAGELLVNLLGSGIVPKKYWLTFLIDTLPLLELEDILIFDSSQTLTLLDVLHQVEEFSHKENNTQESMDISDDVAAGKISLLQLALTRNLQRALLI